MRLTASVDEPALGVGRSHLLGEHRSVTRRVEDNERSLYFPRAESGSAKARKSGSTRKKSLHVHRSRSRRSESARRCRPRYPESSRCNLQFSRMGSAEESSRAAGDKKLTGEEPVLGLLLVEEGDGGQDTERIAAVFGEEVRSTDSSQDRRTMTAERT